MKRENVLAGGAIIGVVAIALWLMNRTQPNQTAGDIIIPGLSDEPPAPTYLVYNVPKLPNLPIITLPNAGTGGNGGLPSNGGTCGCQNQLPDSFFSSLNNLIDYYAQTVTQFEQSYIDSIKSAFPGYVSQYFNNPEGAYESYQSRKYIQGL